MEDILIVLTVYLVVSQYSNLRRSLEVISADLQFVVCATMISLSATVGHIVGKLKIIKNKKCR